MSGSGFDLGRRLNKKGTSLRGVKRIPDSTSILGVKRGSDMVWCTGHSNINMKTFPGIGKLVLQKRKARKGRNPATGEAIKIPAKTVVKMRIAKACKESIVPVKGK